MGREGHLSSVCSLVEARNQSCVSGHVSILRSTGVKLSVNLTFLCVQFDTETLGLRSPYIKKLSSKKSV